MSSFQEWSRDEIEDKDQQSNESFIDFAKSIVEASDQKKKPSVDVKAVPFQEWYSEERAKESRGKSFIDKAVDFLAQTPKESVFGEEDGGLQAMHIIAPPMYIAQKINSISVNKVKDWMASSDVDEKASEFLDDFLRDSQKRVNTPTWMKTIKGVSELYQQGAGAFGKSDEPMKLYNELENAYFETGDRGSANKVLKEMHKAGFINDSVFNEASNDKSLSNLQPVYDQITRKLSSNAVPRHASWGRTLEAFKKGSSEGSILGIADQAFYGEQLWKHDPKFQPSNMLEEVVYSVGAISHDLPFFFLTGGAGEVAKYPIQSAILSIGSKMSLKAGITRAAAGLLGQSTKGFVEFGGVEAIRQGVYEKFIRDDDPDAWKVMEAIKRVSAAGAKGGAVGAAVAPIGQAGKGLLKGTGLQSATGRAAAAAIRFPAEISAVASIPALMEGRTPDLQDFTHATGVMLALKIPNVGKSLTSLKELMTTGKSKTLAREMYQGKMVKTDSRSYEADFVAQQGKIADAYTDMVVMLQEQAAVKAVESGNISGATLAQAKSMKLGQRLEVNKWKHSIDATEKNISDLKVEISKIKGKALKKRGKSSKAMKDLGEQYEDAYSKLDQNLSKSLEVNSVKLKYLKKKLRQEQKVQERRERYIINQNFKKHRELAVSRKKDKGRIEEDVIADYQYAFKPHERALLSQYGTEFNANKKIRVGTSTRQRTVGKKEVLPLKEGELNVDDFKFPDRALRKKLGEERSILPDEVVTKEEFKGKNKRVQDKQGYFYLDKSMMAEDLIVNGLTGKEIAERVIHVQEAAHVSGMVQRAQRISSILESNKGRGSEGKVRKSLQKELNAIYDNVRRIAKNRASDKDVQKTFIGRAKRFYQRGKEMEEAMWSDNYEAMLDKMDKGQADFRRGHIEPAMWTTLRLEKTTGIPFFSFIYKQGRNSWNSYAREAMPLIEEMYDVFNEAGMGSKYRQSHIHKREKIGRFLEDPVTADMRKITSSQRKRAYEMGLTDKDIEVAQKLRTDIYGNEPLEGGNVYNGLAERIGLFNQTGLSPNHFMFGYLPKMRDYTGRGLDPAEFNKWYETSMARQYKGKIPDFYLKHRNSDLDYRIIRDPMMVAENYIKAVLKQQHLGPWLEQVKSMMRHTAEDAYGNKYDTGSIKGPALQWTKDYVDAVLGAPTKADVRAHHYMMGMTKRMESFISKRNPDSNLRAGAQYLLNWMNGKKPLDRLSNAQYLSYLACRPLSVIKNHTQKVMSGMIHGNANILEAWKDWKTNPRYQAMVEASGIISTRAGAYMDGIDTSNIKSWQAFKSRRMFNKKVKQGLKPMGSYSKTDASNRAVTYIASIKRFEALYDKYGFTEKFFELTDMDLLDPIIQRDIVQLLHRGQAKMSTDMVANREIVEKYMGKKGKGINLTDVDKLDPKVRQAILSSMRDKKPGQKGTIEVFNGNSAAHVYGDMFQLLTQFPYESGGSPLYTRGGLKPFIGVFSTWWNHYGHFMASMANKSFNPNYARESSKITGIETKWRPARGVKNFARYWITSTALTAAAARYMDVDIASWFGGGPAPDGFSTPLADLTLSMLGLAKNKVLSAQYRAMNITSQTLFDEQIEMPEWITRSISQSQRDVIRSGLVPAVDLPSGEVIPFVPSLAAKQLLEAVGEGLRYRGAKGVEEAVKNYFGKRPAKRKGGRPKLKILGREIEPKRKRKGKKLPSSF